jgi:hypothetical protein
MAESYVFHGSAKCGPGRVPMFLIGFPPRLCCTIITNNVVGITVDNGNSISLAFCIFALLVKV